MSPAAALPIEFYRYSGVLLGPAVEGKIRSSVPVSTCVPLNRIEIPRGLLAFETVLQSEAMDLITPRNAGPPQNGANLL
jgi:hypothetical protein